MSVALHVAGRGEARPPCPPGHASRLRNTVRYADPTSWLAVEAVGHTGVTRWLERGGDRIAALLVAPAGCPEAAANLGRQAAEGYASPIRYPAAASSASLGLTCIAFGLRGPGLTFTMSLATGVPRALWLAGRYLARGDADLTVVVTVDGEVARAVLIASSRDLDEREHASAWLRGGA